MPDKILTCVQLLHSPQYNWYFLMDWVDQGVRKTTMSPSFTVKEQAYQAFSDLAEANSHLTKLSDVLIDLSCVIYLKKNKNSTDVDLKQGNLHRKMQLQGQEVFEEIKALCAISSNPLSAVSSTCCLNIHELKDTLLIQGPNDICVSAVLAQHSDIGYVRNVAEVMFEDIDVTQFSQMYMA